jgi:hypothetical protein
MLASSYTPGLKIDGVAAIAPATEQVTMGEHMQSLGVGTNLATYLINACSDTYGDVSLSASVRPGATVLVTHAAQRCVLDPSLVASQIAGAGGKSVANRDVDGRALGARLRENTPTGDIGGASLLIDQGTGEEIIDVAMTRQWVAELCAAGYKLALVTYPDLSHLGIVFDSTFTTNLIDWTVDPFAGSPARYSCL